MNNNTSNNTSNNNMWQSLMTLAIIGGVDAVSYMIVTPSLIFYVLQCGGSVEQYGLILSVFSFASFFTKPFLGWWIDANGNKFRAPYATSIGTAIVGSFIYFLASAYQDRTGLAIALIFIGRFMGGVGAANQALGYAYIAATIPHEKQTSTNSLLSMVRVLGMAAGPGFNVFLHKIDTSITIGGTTIAIDELNSVGIFLVVLNIIALLVLLVFLQEPPEKPDHKKAAENAASTGDGSGPSTMEIIKASLTFEIILPIFTLFVFNSAFQLIETGLAPAANDALGWGPVETSAILGGMSVLMVGCMILVMVLSSKRVKDTIIMGIGCMCWTVGGTMMFFLWRRGAKPWHFVVPMIIAVAGFPFIAPSNRSKFTKAVDRIPLLDGKQGMMQAVLSMFASVAGFATPGFVAAYVLRHPEEIDGSSNQRELNASALYVAILPVFVLIGIFFLDRRETKQRLEKEESLGVTDEATQLLAGRHHEGRGFTVVAMQQDMDIRTEMARRASLQVAGTGIPLMMVASERERQDKLHAQMKEFDWSEFVDEDEES